MYGRRRGFTTGGVRGRAAASASVYERPRARKLVEREIRFPLDQAPNTRFRSIAPRYGITIESDDVSGPPPLSPGVFFGK
jgi:hypothetical protein